MKRYLIFWPDVHLEKFGTKISILFLLLLKSYKVQLSIVFWYWIIQFYSKKRKILWISNRVIVQAILSPFVSPTKEYLRRKSVYVSFRNNKIYSPPYKRFSVDISTTNLLNVSFERAKIENAREPNYAGEIDENSVKRGKI